MALTTRGKGAFRRFKDQLHEEHPGLVMAPAATVTASPRKRFVQDFTSRFRGNALVRATGGRRGEFAAVDPALGQLLGRTPVTFHDVLAATLSA